MTSTFIDLSSAISFLYKVNEGDPKSFQDRKWKKRKSGYFFFLLSEKPQQRSRE